MYCIDIMAKLAVVIVVKTNTTVSAYAKVTVSTSLEDALTVGPSVSVILLAADGIIRQIAASISGHTG